MPFSFRDETEELNEVTRKQTAGSFVRLPQGFTHYELSNPEIEATAVLVHGFSVPYFIYDPTFEFLTASGFRVLRYDLFGRGFSDRPQAEYTLEFFVDQLGDLLDALGFTSPVSLVALSTGGPIIAAYAERLAERVSKLVLIDPVGAMSLPFAWLLKVAALPLVGETIASVVTSRSAMTGIASAFFDRELVQHFRSRYVIQMKYKGFRDALLSTIRNNVLTPRLELYERVGKLGKPVLLFWGRDDATVPFSHSALLRAAMPQLQFHPVENCGHTPHYEKPEVVNPVLLSFLQS